MTTQERVYSADDLWNRSHEQGSTDRRFELVKGAIIEVSPAGGEHGDIASEFNLLVRLHVKQYRLGYVTAAETGYILFTDPVEGDTVRAPDVGFVAAERLPNGLPKSYIPVPPDLAIEVVSPNDKAGDIERKIEDYLRAGIPLFVFVYADTRTFMVYTRSQVFRLTENDTFDAGDVLPGFRITVRDVFPASR